jgi:DNA-binding response OmpR family regulator
LFFGSFLILKPSYDKGLHHFERRLAEENHTISELVFGPLILYPERRSAVLNNTPLSLTPTEFDFLTYLVEHQDRAVSRDELLKNLWQYNWQADTRAADDLVKRLRRKLRECKSGVRIEIVWGFGFRLEKESVS